MAIFHEKLLTVLRSADAEPPKVRGGFANTAGAAQTINVSFVLPAGIQDGDEAVAQLSFNSGVATLSDQGGWDLVDGPQTNPAGNLRSYLLKKSLVAADAGTTVNMTLTAGLRWTVSGIVVINGDTSAMTSVQWLDNTDDLALSIPAITPPSGKDYLLVTLAGVRYTSTVTGVTPGGSWTELIEAVTTNGTAPLFGTWVGVSVVPEDTAGYATPAVDMVYAATARNNAWLLAIPYAAAVSGRIIERWNGSALVPIRSDKWNGSVLVQQTSEI